MITKVGSNATIKLGVMQRFIIAGKKCFNVGNSKVLLFEYKN